MKILSSLLALSVTLLADITLPQDFRTDFKQTITNETGKVIKYEGNVVFKNLKESLSNTMENEEIYARSFFKWSYTVPTKKEVCTDGTQLIVIDHDLEQVSTYLINDGINLEAILKVAQKLSTHAYKANYKEVEYLIALDDKEQLHEIVYVDNLDNAVKITFKNMHYNVAVEANDLECNAPVSYDMIKG